MKNIVALDVAVALLTGCASKTAFGNCVGLGEKQDPRLEYKVSVRNVIIGIFFVELIVPPIFVLVDQFYCPVGIVPKAEK